ncbi:hypothetical protein V8E36_007955, partial [Tilletia maclaganii]
MQGTIQAVLVCDFCGLNCGANAARTVPRSELDTSVLATAVDHVRTTLSVESICTYAEGGSDFVVCSTCAACIDKGAFTRVPAFSYANACWIGDVPPELSELSYVESLAIARARGTRCFIKIEKGPTGQSAALGNVCILQQQPRSLATVLPPPLNQLYDEIAVVFVTKDAQVVNPRSTESETLTRSPVLMRRSRILKALTWLKMHNAVYKDIDIDSSTAEQYPENGPLP